MDFLGVFLLTRTGIEPQNFAIPFSMAEVAETQRFVGREKELEAIHLSLAGDGRRRTVVLHGLGGMGKTLSEMTAEVVKNNEEHGWYENCATFPEAMAMLHSEVSEALEAWRKWGLEDKTDPDQEQAVAAGFPPGKPEGVGSEFADIFIRLLDDAWLYGQVDLEPWELPASALAGKSFPANMNALHDLISAVSTNVKGGSLYVQRLSVILSYLQALCQEYGIDLEAEYERKMVYNRTRPYRHGGKAI